MQCNQDLKKKATFASARPRFKHETPPTTPSFCFSAARDSLARQLPLRSPAAEKTKGRTSDPRCGQETEVGVGGEANRGLPIRKGLPLRHGDEDHLEGLQTGNPFIDD